jgi:hypothetical protein
MIQNLFRSDTPLKERARVIGVDKQGIVLEGIVLGANKVLSAAWLWALPDGTFVTAAESEPR